MRKVTGPDGIERSALVEAKINLTTVSALGNTDGTALMDYLKSITTQRVCGPHVSDNELRHLEGQRYIVGLLSQRIALGHKEKSNARSEPKPRTGA